VNQFGAKPSASITEMKSVLNKRGYLQAVVM